MTRPLRKYIVSGLDPEQHGGLGTVSCLTVRMDVHLCAAQRLSSLLRSFLVCTHRVQSSCKPRGFLH